MNLEKLLEQISALPPPSTHQKEACKVFEELSRDFPLLETFEIKALADELTQDPLGIFLKTKKTSFSKKALFGLAHLSQERETKKPDQTQSEKENHGEDRDGAESEKQVLKNQDRSEQIFRLWVACFFQLVHELLLLQRDQLSLFFHAYRIDLGFVRPAEPVWHEKEDEQHPSNDDVNENIFATEQDDDSAYEPMETPSNHTLSLFPKEIQAEGPSTWEELEGKIRDYGSLIAHGNLLSLISWNDPSLLELLGKVTRQMAEHPHLRLSELITSYYGIFREPILEKPATLIPILLKPVLQEIQELPGEELKRTLSLSILEQALGSIESKGIAKQEALSAIFSSFELVAPLLSRFLEEIHSKAKTANKEILPAHLSSLRSICRVAELYLSTSENHEAASNLLIQSGILKAMLLITLRIGEKTELGCLIEFLTFAPCISDSFAQYLAASPPFVALLSSKKFGSFPIPQTIISLIFTSLDNANIDRKALFQLSCQNAKQIFTAFELKHLPELTEALRIPASQQRALQDQSKTLGYLALWTGFPSGKAFFQKESIFKKYLVSHRELLKGLKAAVEEQLGAQAGQQTEEQKEEGLASKAKVLATLRNILMQQQQSLKLILIEETAKKD